MKKFFLTLFVFTTSAGYMFYQYTAGASASQVLQTNTLALNTPVAQVQPVPDTLTADTPVVTPTKTPVAKPTQTPTTKPTSTPPISGLPTGSTPTPVVVPVPVPAPKPKGQYKDGTYTGLVVDGYYGPVQMQAVIQGGRLVSINALQYPTDRQNSRKINTRAVPILISEAIQAQSAQVSAVSGASVTSPAFVETLADALSQAKNI